MLCLMKDAEQAQREQRGEIEAGPLRRRMMILRANA